MSLLLHKCRKSVTLFGDEIYGFILAETPMVMVACGEGRKTDVVRPDMDLPFVQEVTEN